MLIHIDQKSKELIQYLKLLQNIRPSKRLRNKLEQEVQLLPVQKNGWYMPLTFVQVGVVAFVILILIMVGSGVVVASQLTEKGQPWYPIRQTMEKLPVPFVHKKGVSTLMPTHIPVVVTITPSVTQTPTEKPHAPLMPKNSGIREVIHQAVKAVFDFAGNHQEKQQSKNTNYKTATYVIHNVKK